MPKTLDILIPSWNNAQFLIPCVTSILKTGELRGLARLIIVNNGKQPVKEQFHGVDGITVIDAPSNLGWEGGLKLGLEHSDAPFVCFQNDDTLVPRSSAKLYQQLLVPFIDPTVGATGPVTTCAGNIQSIFHPATPNTMQDASFLIFFCAVVRRSYLDAVGGIDDTLPGGDDLDLSLRLTKAGKRLVVVPDAFLIHHGFKTGERVNGGPGKPGGWNSQEMTDRTNNHLIKKHGFKSFFLMVSGQVAKQEGVSFGDVEGDMVRTYIQGDHILELGCGPKKTVPNAIGVDRVGPGEIIPFVPGESKADVNADVQEPLPFPEQSQDTVVARHILEHCLDPIRTLKNWNRVIKTGGRLVIAVPDEGVTRGIPLNPEHVHAFNKESLKSLTEVCGFKELEAKHTGNWVSFVGCYEKVEHMN